MYITIYMCSPLMLLTFSQISLGTALDVTFLKYVCVASLFICLKHQCIVFWIYHALPCLWTITHAAPSYSQSCLPLSCLFFESLLNFFSPLCSYSLGLPIKFSQSILFFSFPSSKLSWFLIKCLITRFFIEWPLLDDNFCMSVLYWFNSHGILTNVCWLY